MLTEKSITQQLLFHKVPFPEDLGRGGRGGAGGNHCFVPEPGPPGLLGPGLQLPPDRREGSGGAPEPEQEGVTWEKGLVPTRPHHPEPFERSRTRLEMRPRPCLTQEERKSQGQSLAEVPAPVCAVKWKEGAASTPLRWPGACPPRLPSLSSPVCLPALVSSLAPPLSPPRLPSSPPAAVPLLPLVSGPRVARPPGRPASL